MRIGTTYYGNYQSWSGIPDSVLEKDFQRFKDDGVEIVILCTFWNAIESTQGNYNQSVFDRLKHITSKANEYGLKVVHNIHTWSTGSNVPSYIGNQRDTFLDNVKKGHWLDFVGKFIEELDAENVEGFQLCNELGLNQYSGWINENGDISNYKFYEWMKDTYNAGRAVTDKPLSGRFGMVQSMPTYLEDRVIQIWDYMSLNYYDGIDSQSNEQGIVDRVNRFKALGKDTWITEYGLRTTNDENQRALYERVLQFFQDAGIKTATAWWWSGQTGLGYTEYNIADGSGNPRPAYNEMLTKVKRKLPKLNGLSGSVDSLEDIDNVIAFLKEHKLNCYRIAFNPQWTTGSRPWHETSQYGPDGKTKIDYFLNHPDFQDKYLIIDRTHMTDQSTGGELPYTGTATRSWNTVRQNALDMVALYGDRENVGIEYINEYWWSNMYPYCEALSKEIRRLATKCFLINNKHNIANDWDRHKRENPTLDRFGMHWYFSNDTSDYNKLSEYKRHMQMAMDNELVPICNTEMGAHHQEQNYFNAENVGRFNEAIIHAQDKPIGILIWCNHNLNNTTKYLQLGLRFDLLSTEPDTTPTTTPIGLSSYPRKQDYAGSPYHTDAIDEVISVMNDENLTAWRMTFKNDFADWEQFIQYYLDNCPYELIVDYYHLAPNQMTEAQWTESMSKGLEIANAFSDYADRIWLEPLNEQKFVSTFVDKAQAFVDLIRGAGHRHRIVMNVFWEPYITALASVIDPLNRFYTGQHIYFYSNGTTQNWHVGGGDSRDATKLMQDALDAGLKLVNTEIGADSAGQAYFTSEMVGVVNEFMAWCQERGIGNHVWTLYGDHDYPKYEELGLEFPTGGEEVSFVYNNEGNDDTTLYARKITIVERPIVIPAGESLTITLEEGEEIVEKN